MKCRMHGVMAQCRGLLDAFESHKIYYPSVMLRSAIFRHGRSTYLMRTHDEGDLYYLWTTASDTMFRSEAAKGLQGPLEILSFLSETLKLLKLVTPKTGKNGGIKEPVASPKRLKQRRRLPFRNCLIGWTFLLYQEPHLELEVSVHQGSLSMECYKLMDIWASDVLERRVCE